MKEYALKYFEMGFNVIPLNEKKRPRILEVTPYHNKRIKRNLIEKWWDTWPDANIGLLTGTISNLFIVDVDSEAALLEIDPYLNGNKPTVKSPNGWHYYFKYNDCGLTIGQAFLPGCDFRGQTGYIVAPPSKVADDPEKNKKGGTYKQLQSIEASCLDAVPEDILSLINSSSSTIYIGSDHTDHTDHTDHKMFGEGTKDADLFHTANCLVKGGMKNSNINQVLENLIKSWGESPDQKWIDAKIKSALKRDEGREKTIIQELRDLIMTTSGHITTTNGHNWLQVTTRKEKKSVNMAFLRLEEEGLIEKTGKRAGEYRIKSQRAKAEKLTRTLHKYADIKLPFELNDIVDIPEGSLIIIAGSPNAGKSACLFNIAKENQKKWKVKYLSTETTNDEMSARISNAFPNQAIEDWTLEFFKVETENLMDNVYDSDKNTLWLIDYIEKYDVFFTIGQDLSTLHSKLNGGVMVASVQKNPDAEVGIGGFFTMMKPTLGLSLDWDPEFDTGTCTITKAKAVKDSHRIEKQYGDPTKKIYEYKLIDNVKPQKIKWWYRKLKKKGKSDG